jgi:hypothetical protein
VWADRAHLDHFAVDELDPVLAEDADLCHSQELVGGEPSLRRCHNHEPLRILIPVVT